MPLQATSGAASYDAFGGGVPYIPQYIEDVFSTWLYTGNGTSQTITNGIDLAGKGGLVWIKNRSATSDHLVTDTVRGANTRLWPNLTVAQSSSTAVLTAFNANGFNIADSSVVNGTGSNYASWTFREQPKFFDVVTFTAPSSGVITINHNLGSVPGCVILKRTDASQMWVVNHRSLDNTKYLVLNDPAGEASASPLAVTYGATTVTYSAGYLTANAQYVAYLFAHDAGGFGLTGTDNVISCGSFTTDGSGNATVNLGYEPQWLLIKRTNAAQNWIVVDTMRGWTVRNSDDAVLNPNTSDAENGTDTIGFPTATGFQYNLGSSSSPFIYIAIRRGPMKVPTTGTSVYSPQTSTGVQTTNFVVDAFIGVNQRASPGSFDPFEKSRLQGGVPYLTTSSTAAEASGSNVGFDSNTGVTLSWSAGGVNWYFRRAPGFFDVVCYTGNQTTRTVNHNLAAAPELIITKNRSSAGFTAWLTCVPSIGMNNILSLNTSGATDDGWGSPFTSTPPTSSVFGLSSGQQRNETGVTYVAYLFASCPGVSKVGSYTGTGTTQTINCGFTAGSRFVMIKRTDSTGDWYVWDSARGIVAGNDPYLLLNSTAAEVTNTDFIDTAATGFEISSTAPAAINASGGTFIFLAIA